MSAKETPGEIFKRALAHAARSLAEQPDLEVVFSGDGPSLVGNRAVLPHPPRELSGAGDHPHPRPRRPDGAARRPPRRGRPRPGQAEVDRGRARSTTRWSRRGSRPSAPMRWAACATTWPRCWEQAVQRKGLDHLVDPAAAPMADIVALMVRERLTGDRRRRRPRRPLVDAFRAEIEAKAGADLDRLTGAVEDQKAFARIARAIVRDLDMGEDSSDAPDQDGAGRREPRTARPRPPARARARARSRRRRARRSTTPRRRRPRIRDRRERAHRGRGRRERRALRRRAGDRRRRQARPARHQGPRPAPSRPTRSSPPPTTRWSPPRSCATPRS